MLRWQDRLSAAVRPAACGARGLPSRRGEGAAVALDRSRRPLGFLARHHEQPDRGCLAAPPRRQHLPVPGARRDRLALGGRGQRFPRSSRPLLGDPLPFRRHDGRRMGDRLPRHHPENLRSGVYAVRLVPDDDEESAYHCVFVVRPKTGVRSSARTCFLLPTASYLAYANHRLGMDVPGTEIGMGRLVEMDRHHVFLQEHPEFGFSFYEVHADGSGVFYSSRNRPIVDMQPGVKGFLGGLGSNVWQFDADTHITGWLDSQRRRLRCDHRRGPASGGSFAPARLCRRDHRDASRVLFDEHARRRAGLCRSRRTADVSGRQRLLLADIVQRRVSRGDRMPPLGSGHPALGTRRRPVSPCLHRRVRRLVAAQRPLFGAPHGAGDGIAGL